MADVAQDVVKTESWFRRNWVKIATTLTAGWTVFEYMAPMLAGRVHQFLLHIFWGDFMHKLFHIGSHASNVMKK